MKNPGKLRLAAFAAMWIGTRVASAQSCQANCVLVNDAGDGINPSCNVSGIGTCSLRDAITMVGYLNGFVIQFAIGTGPQRIDLMSNLPGICGSGDIDGRTQPGFAGVPLIEIHSAHANAWHGLLIGDPPLLCNGPVTVRSLVINHFGNFGCGDCGGIIMENPGGNFILGCYIGTDASGTVADGNYVGILDDTFGGNHYGGVTAADRNVISGNGNGIQITNGRGGYSAQDVIQGNYLGTDVTGTVALPNAGLGIAAGPPYAGFSPGILIGGPPGSGAGNVIVGGGGIRLTSGGGNIVQGNSFGLDKTGLVALPMANGIELDGEINATIADNLISAQGYGIGFFADAASTRTHGATVQGNYIGTDATGNKVLVAGGYGLDFSGGQNNTIGGAGAGQGNVIGGFLHGVHIGGLTDTGNVIQGNLIGIGVDGSPIPNVQAGIAAWGAGGNTVVGGDGVGEQNYIAYNGLGAPPGSIAPGVSVLNGTGNVIRGNSMFLNTGLAIDFSFPFSPSPYPNDVGDPDTGANKLQNFPLITDWNISGNTIQISGTLNSQPNTLYAIDLYADFPPVHPSDFLQGKNYLGLAESTTDAAGNATFTATFTVPQLVPPYLWFTATASDPGGIPGANTSEMSQRSLFSVTPNRGPAAGGTSTTLKGQLFQPLAVERFGSIVTTNTAFIDEQTITAVTPPMPAGTLLDVSISNPDGSVALMQKAFMVEFNDVPPSHAFYDYVMSLAGDGVTGGCGGGNYCPASDVTRAQMAVFLLKAKYGLWWMPPSPTGTLFGDVASDSFAAGWIEELYNEGITGGCSSSPLLYCPGNPVKRQQMSVFLLKTEHGSGYVPPVCQGIFSDVTCPGTFANWIERLYNENITGGCGAGIFCPTNNVTRGQMAVFIVKTFQLP